LIEVRANGSISRSYAAQSAMIISPETYKERAKKTVSKQAEFLRLLG
jgi:hypothetical protein